MLRVFKLTMSKPKILTSLTGVTHFYYHNLLHALPKGGAQILSKLPNLQHLALTLHAYPAPRSSMPRIALPFLTSLELVWMTNANSFLFLFDFFELANLQTLVLHHQYISEQYEAILQSLV